MNKYESVIIINPSVDEEGNNQIHDSKSRRIVRKPLKERIR